MVRLGLLLFFRKIVFQNRKLLNEKGPLLLACTHPNSFLDALILGSYFNQPVHFLARGDAFQNPLAKKLLTALKVIPIYRLSEGKEYLALNDTTFEKCTKILAEGGIVLIFSEGLCVNQWKLRPLKKGSARIALSAWKQQPIANSFRILPVSFNYSSFTSFRKSLVVYLGKEITREDISTGKAEGEQISELNKIIFSRLEKGLMTEENNPTLVKFLLSNFEGAGKKGKGIIEDLKDKQNDLHQLDEGDFDKLTGTKKAALNNTQLLISIITIPVLFIPAFIGLIVHFPLYLALKQYIKKKTEGTVFYHSALFGSLIIFYPVYALIITGILMIITGKLAFITALLLLPFLALIVLLFKDLAEGVINYYKLPMTVIKILE